MSDIRDLQNGNGRNEGNNDEEDKENYACIKTTGCRSRLSCVKITASLMWRHMVCRYLLTIRRKLLPSSSGWTGDDGCNVFLRNAGKYLPGIVIFIFVVARISSLVDK
jgi:hypothetical protein